MSPRKSRGFEFKLGKTGLFLFTFGMALLILAAFIFGVQVGKNIDTYPKKIARVIPNRITGKIPQKETPKNSKTKKGAVEEGKRDTDKDLKMSFYDTLTKKQKGIAVPPEKKKKIMPAAAKSSYTVRVASFRDKKMVTPLEKRLAELGYKPVVKTISLKTSGKWYRVQIEGIDSLDNAKKISEAVSSKIRGVKCLIVKNAR